MANCHSLFKDFNDTVKLGNSYKSELRTSRNDLRKKVRAKFREQGYEVKFHEQGSFAMGTIIQPKDGNYDIDDGIYLLQNNEPETPIATLHALGGRGGRGSHQHPAERPQPLRAGSFQGRAPCGPRHLL